jgi:hypothetical protein
MFSAAFFGLIVLTLCSGCREKRAPAAESRYWLRQLAIAVRTYEVDNNVPINEAISRISKDSLSTRDRLLAILRKNRQLFDGPFADIESHVKNDGWNNPFNVDYTTNVVAGASNTLYESLSQCPIVIWSNGRNQVNDHCLGDDIPWPISEIRVDSGPNANTNSPSH